MFSCFIAARHFPCSSESDKVIYTDDIYRFQRVLYAFDPPSETIIPHRIPIVDRIAPELARLAEKIRWNSRHDDWRAVRIQFELILVTPDVCRIKCDKYRDVA